MKTECTVYIHRNLTNGKVYVGMTTQSVRRRWRSGKGYRSMRFGRAIDKYGWDGFEHVIVRDKLSIEEARQLEKDIIKELDATNPKKGYNEAVGGQWGGFYKKHHSDEAKEKIRQARLRDGFSEANLSRGQSIIMQSLFTNTLLMVCLLRSGNTPALPQSNLA